MKDTVKPPPPLQLRSPITHIKCSYCGGWRNTTLSQCTGCGASLWAGAEELSKRYVEEKTKPMPLLVPGAIYPLPPEFK